MGFHTQQVFITIVKQGSVVDYEHHIKAYQYQIHLKISYFQVMGKLNGHKAYYAIKIEASEGCFRSTSYLKAVN